MGEITYAGAILEDNAVGGGGDDAAIEDEKAYDLQPNATEAEQEEETDYEQHRRDCTAEEAA